MAPRRTTSRRFSCGALAALEGEREEEAESIIRVEGLCLAAWISVRDASRLSWLQAHANDFRGRVVLGIAYNHDAPSTSLDLVTFGNGVGGVVRALGMKIRMDLPNDCAHVVLGKNDDGVDVRKDTEGEKDP